LKPRSPFELPAEHEREMQHATRLEWYTLGFMLTIVGVMSLTMGSSQAMKAAWVEDMLGLVPPIAFLIASRWRAHPPNERFPYGYHRALSISFLVAAVSLTGFGVFILVDSLSGLIRAEHPAIGTTVILGQSVWSGWLMIAALVYSGLPPMVLGRMKLKVARALHDKTLKADADMNKADWLTAGAGIFGIVGIGAGFWWADAAAAGIISLDIVKDGVQNLKRVVADLMDQRPTTIEGEVSDVPEKVRDALQALPWVRWARVRLREEGHVFAGEAFIEATPELATLSSAKSLACLFEEAGRVARAADWRVYDVVVTLARAEE